jgi:hypothetical protein
MGFFPGRSKCVWFTLKWVWLQNQSEFETVVSLAIPMCAWVQLPVIFDSLDMFRNFELSSSNEHPSKDTRP